MKTSFFVTTWAILQKDLRAELRSRELLATMLLFALLSVLVFSFALELDRIAREEAVSGVFWVTIVFASILGLNRSMAMENEQDNMNAMLLAPIDRSAIYLGKFIGNLLIALVVATILLPLMTILYNINMVNPFMILIAFLGTIGVSSTGTLLSAMTVKTRARDALLPIALLPVALPVLYAAVKGSTGIISEQPAEQWLTWLQILLVIDTIYLVMCFIGFTFVVEE